LICWALLPSHSFLFACDDLPPKNYFLVFNIGTEDFIKSASNAAASGALDNLSGSPQQVSAVWYAIGLL